MSDKPAYLNPIPRSQCKAMFAYTVQTQAPAGNWVDSVSMNRLDDAQDHAAYLASIGHAVRIVDNNA